MSKINRKQGKIKRYGVKPTKSFLFFPNDFTSYKAAAKYLRQYAEMLGSKSATTYYEASPTYHEETAIRNLQISLLSTSAE